ncbi:hypothetical protein Tco_0537747 [Tanacetum coccineum]
MSWHADGTSASSVVANEEALLRGVVERLNKLDQDSNTDIKVFDVNAPNIQNHDVFAELFGVSLKSYKDIDDFTKGIELGKYPMWLELTREKHNEVLDTIGDIWDALVEESMTRANSLDPVVSKSLESVNPTFDNNMPSKVVPSDSIVQSVYIHEQLSSYVGAVGGSKMEPSKLKANFRSLCSEIFCDGAKFSIPRKDVLQESLTMGVPLIKGTGFTIETVTNENEWKPPRCELCKIFSHVQDHFPKKVSITPSVVTSNVVTPTIEKTND